MHQKNDIAPAKTLSAFVWFFLKKQWLKFALVQVLWLAWSLDQTIFPILFGKIVDNFTNYVGDRSLAWPVLKDPILLAIFFWIGIEISFRLGGILMAYSFPKMEKNMRMYMFSHMHNQSHSYFSSQFAGNIATRISDMVDNLSHILDLIFTMFVPTVVAVMIATFTFYQLNPFFAALLLGWAILHCGVGIAYASRCSYYSYLHSQARSQLNGSLLDSLINYFAVKIFANKRYELSYIKKAQDKEQKLNQQQKVYIEKVRLLFSIFSFFGPGLGLNGYAYWCWTQNLISVGDIVLIFNTSWNIMMMLWWSSMEFPNFFQEIGICQQALTLLQEPITLVDKPDAQKLKVTSGKIEFEKVHFHYKGTNPLFSDKSVVIPPAQKVGLVGYSGSGKTSFVNLILRLFDIQSGRISIDSQDISEVTQESLHRAITLIPQDPSLFHRSLMDNIRYGKVDASDEEVIEAAKKAHAHEFALSLSEGYDTPVGERGKNIRRTTTTHRNRTCNLKKCSHFNS
jgi:ATP-binding cassette subfamily B protein